MKYTPYPYQVKAHRWLLAHEHCALFLDMGLGKSVITLTAVQDLLLDCEVSKVLVVAPKKVAESTWTAEADKWDHLSDLRVVRVIGTPVQRERALRTEADVYVVGRDSLVWLLEFTKGKPDFDMAVFDELTSFKTYSSQRSRAARAIAARCRRVVGLTGTPAPNGYQDLWAQMRLIDGGLRLGKFKGPFLKLYFNSYVWNNIPVRYTLRPGCDKIIEEKIADICLTMQARDYLTLPPLMVRDVYAEFSPEEALRYKELERERVLSFKEESGDASVLAQSAAALLGKLSQLANGAVYDDDHVAHTFSEAKVQALVELVEAAAVQSEPVLVFYQYRHDADRIAKALAAYKPRVYAGDKDLQAWNARQLPVLLAHPASTAYGLNMQQGGRYIVWFGLCWNLELYQQANARLYRQGQERPVIVYRLMTRGTVDSRVAAAIDGKNTSQQSLIDNLKRMAAALG